MFLLGILSLLVMIVAFAVRSTSGRHIVGPRILQQFDALLFSSPENETGVPQDNRIEDLL